MICINGKFYKQRLSGVQRFAKELTSRILSRVDCKVIEPSLPLNLTLWEQVVLPGRAKLSGCSLLVNFTNTAPLLCNSQIVTVHDLAFLKYRDFFNPIFSKWYSFLIPRIIRKARKVITVSNFSKEEIIKTFNIKEDRISIIYNAVSSKFTFNPTISKESYILAVASLDPRKNFVNLILAFRKINLKAYKLIIVGAESRVFSDLGIRKIVKKTANIEFTGYVSDEELVSLYQRAKLFVYPSLYEGFGIPPLEAMACGTPVVVSNVASLPEVCGDAAYYVNPYDVDDIARGIETVLKDEILQKELIRKGLERVKLFSWDKSASRFIKIIKEVS